MEGLLSSKTLADILLQQYNLELVSAKPLQALTYNSYHVKAKSVHGEGIMRDLTIKVNRLLSPDEIKSLEMQAALMEHLDGKGIVCSTVIPNKYGQLIGNFILPMNSENEGEIVIQLLTYIPGEDLFECSYTPALLQDAGETIAALKKAFQGFRNPSLPMLDPVEAWEKTDFQELLKKAQKLKDEEQRVLVTEILTRFIQQFEPNVCSLNTSIQHGDLHPGNIILVDHPLQPNQLPGLNRKLGIIDFGLVRCSFSILELCLTMSGFMVCSLEEEDMLENAGHILSGYLRHESLSDIEWELLPITCCAVIGRVLVMISDKPEEMLNAGYSKTARAIRRIMPLLKHLWGMTAEDILKRLKKVCKI